MAHFAKLNDSNVVESVIAVHNNELLVDGVESEEKGLAFVYNLFGDSSTWIQTSYHGNLRKNYAGVGHIHDEGRDAFIGLQDFPSWVLNEETCQWEAPSPYPDDGQMYHWNESNQEWEIRSE